MPKSLKMDAYSETRQKVFAAPSAKFTVAKSDLAEASVKFAAAKVSKIQRTKCTTQEHSLQ